MCHPLDTVIIPHPALPGVRSAGADLTVFGSSRLFKELYHSWLYIVFVFGLPFVALAVLNAFLVHAVRLSRLRCRELLQRAGVGESSGAGLSGPGNSGGGGGGVAAATAESRRIDTTVMLIGVVVIFIVCQLPALVSRALWAFVPLPHFAFTDLPLYTLNETANFLVVLNSSVNILPYYFFGRRFRREFLSIFCRCFRRAGGGVGGTGRERRKFSMSLSRRDSTELQTANIAAPTAGRLWRR